MARKPKMLPVEDQREEMFRAVERGWRFSAGPNRS